MTNTSWLARLIVATLLLGLAATGCGGDDDATDDEPDTAALAEDITHCDTLLLSPRQVGDVLGIKVLAPQPVKADEVVLGCEYASLDKAAGGGQLSVDAATTDAPPPEFTTPTTPVEGVGDQAEFNPQPDATTILRVWSGDLILDFEVGGTQLYEQFGGQKEMQPPLVDLAQQALTALEDVSA